MDGFEKSEGGSTAVPVWSLSGAWHGHLFVTVRRQPGTGGVTLVGH